MVKLLFKAPAFVIDEDDETSDLAKIKSLDGLKYDDEDAVFSDYISDGGYTSLEDAGVSGGIMYFKFDDSKNSLYGYVEYVLAQKLTDKEVESLKDYTIGQLTDGIGSNFAQDRKCEEELLPIIDCEQIVVIGS